MHMISKKDLSKAEMDTLTKSCSPTIVITVNGEVQTHEEAVYVKEVDTFLTMKVLENTPAALSLGKLCDDNGYSYEWINGQKPHLIKNGIRIGNARLKFMNVCITASFGTVFPRTVIPHSSVFHEPLYRTGLCNQVPNLGWLSSLILLRRRTRSKNPTTLLGALSPVCAS